jgi:hypothetical protein
MLGRPTIRSKTGCRVGIGAKKNTELNGNPYDMTEFKKQMDAAYAGAKKE